MAGDRKEGQDLDNKYTEENANRSEGGGGGIAIELTSSQIDRVVRDAVGAGNMSILLLGHGDRQETLARASQLLDDPHISRSLMRGLLIVAALPSDENYIGVVELSKALDMSPSTAHRYLATLIRLGLVERDASSRKYRLAR